MYKIIHVVGARPNFMKIAPVMAALRAHADHVSQVLVHTGQHYSPGMSKAFFEDLGLPEPDVNLEAGSGTHAEQTARVMVEFEKVCVKEKPDLVVVVGDVNSTLACAITAKKLAIKVAHVEAGLRSRDMSMPEEINRLCTDAISDYLFTPDELANQNLRTEGVSEERIHFVGNVMIDTLLRHREYAQRLSVLERLGLQSKNYATVTLHRPSNVDHEPVLRRILEALREIAQSLPVVFPAHPRTRTMIERFGLSELLSNGWPVRGLWMTEPLGYLEFLHLNMHARLVLTDSGGLQEETTVLGVPCVTIRRNTERPITCSIGTNRVVGNGKEAIVEAARAALRQDGTGGRIPEKWDGRAGERVVNHLMAALAHPSVTSSAVMQSREDLTATLPAVAEIE